MRWFELPVVSELPVSLRLWAWWLRYGPRRSSGGTLGGSALFRLARRLGGSCVTLSGGPYRLSVDPCDFEVFNHTLGVWLNGSPESWLLQSLLRPGDVLLDVGANYGLYSLLAASLGGRAVAIEPQPRVASCLRSSVAANGFDVQVIESFAGDSCDSVAFFSPVSGSGTASADESRAAASGSVQRIEVPRVTIDSLNLPRVDLMKIDVEGFEPAVIRGAVETIRRFTPAIWFEVNTPETRELLESLGYSDFEAVDGMNLSAFHPSRPRPKTA
jgi:FkbM family methyltransferase